MLKKIFVLIKVAVILNLFICLINREWAATFVCLFNFILFFVADFVQKKLRYGDFFQFLVYIFLIGSLMGGEVYNLYARIKYFDNIMHALSSFLVSGLFLYIRKLFKSSINKILLVICIFSFAMMIASLWEITEFSIDRLFDTDMQKDTVITEVNSALLSDNDKDVVKNKINSMTIGSYTIDGYLDIGLYDTIEDMICAVVGSILFIVVYKYKEASI